MAAMAAEAKVKFLIALAHSVSLAKLAASRVPVFTAPYPAKARKSQSPAVSHPAPLNLKSEVEEVANVGRNLWHVNDELEAPRLILAGSHHQFLFKPKIASAVTVAQLDRVVAYAIVAESKV